MCSESVPQALEPLALHGTTGSWQVCQSWLMTSPGWVTYLEKKKMNVLLISPTNTDLFWFFCPFSGQFWKLRISGKSVSSRFLKIHTLTTSFFLWNAGFVFQVLISFLPFLCFLCFYLFSFLSYIFSLLLIFLQCPCRNLSCNSTGILSLLSK